MTFGSLFAGVGGFDLGLERAGMRCAWQVEIDTAARSVLAHHWPDVPRYDDVQTVGKHNLSPVDVICGGFPCQDLSVAGKRAGITGARSGLFFEMVRITHELRPAFLIWENVPGLLTSANGRDFAAVLMALDGIGYHGAWTGLDARYFGLAQRRRRIFGVFARDDIGAGRCAEVLALTHRLHGHTEAGREEGEDSPAWTPAGFGRYRSGTGTLRANGGDSGGESEVIVAGTLGAYHQRNNMDGDGAVVAYGGNNTSGPIDIATAVNAHGGTGRLDFESETFVVNTANSGANQNNVKRSDVTDTLDSFASQAVFVFEPRFARNGRGAPSDIVPPLKAESGQTGKGDGASVVYYSHEYRQDSVYDTDGPSNAIAVSRTRQAQSYQTSTGLHRLTPTECERLQGFPDGWTAGQADGPRYRQLGNAVAVPVVEWIGRRIMEADIDRPL